ncbi:MAG: GNAT family N-acetyltransferase [Pseudomonadota bacterium]
MKPLNAQAALPQQGVARRSIGSDAVSDGGAALPWIEGSGPFAPNSTLPSYTPRALQDGMLEVSVYDRLEEVRDEWLEMEASALATPYQQYRFIEAWNETLNAKGQTEIRIVIGRDSAGTPLMILPLGVQISRVIPFKPSTGLVWLGDKHVNYNQGLFAPELLEHWNKAAWQRVLTDILDIIEPDHVCLLNQPVSIHGHANPLLAVTHRASPSQAFAANIDGAPEAVLSRLRNRMSRKKIRRKIRRLEEVAGQVHLIHAATTAEIAETLDTMKRQRFVRRGSMGVPAEQHLAFLRHAADPGNRGIAPPIEIFALKAGEETVATFGCAVHAGRASGMFISVDVERFADASPGDLILSEAIAAFCARGFHTFDLGIGEFEYKRRWCDGKQDLFDVVSGHRSRIGASAATAIRHWLDCKSYVKSRPRLHRFLGRMQSMWPGSDGS